MNYQQYGEAAEILIAAGREDLAEALLKTPATEVARRFRDHHLNPKFFLWRQASGFCIGVRHAQESTEIDAVAQLIGARGEDNLGFFQWMVDVLNAGAAFEDEADGAEIPR